MMPVFYRFRRHLLRPRERLSLLVIKRYRRGNRLAIKRTAIVVTVGLMTSTLAVAGAAGAFASSLLVAGQWLTPGQYLMSGNGAFQFIMQTDGNLVLYYFGNSSGGVPERALWNSGTVGQSVQGVIMQTDGNLVIYRTDGSAAWNSGTPGHSGTAPYISVQTDGNVVLYSNVGVLWATWTQNGMNTESLGAGNCWQAGTPFTCRTAWTHVGQFMPFTAIDQFSINHPEWRGPANTAVSAWNAAPGPQEYSWSHTAGDSWIYLVDSQTGQHDLSPGVLAITWQCQSNSYCSDVAMAIDAQWSNIYLNADTLANQPNNVIVYTVLHESGHAMMLAHDPFDSSSVMYPDTQFLSQTPDGNDTGAYPGCANAGFGTSCIYGYGR